ncbi:MAG: LamG-like jellyroll fold domain-containing protein [Limisphaerales bacterium]
MLWRSWRWVACFFLVILAAAPAWVVRASAQEVRILERGENHNVVQRVTAERDRIGATILVTNTWVQLESALNYWDVESERWLESREEIELTRTGAMALQGPMRAIFSSNANDPNGALDIEVRHSVRLRSSLLALRYFDAATGGSAVLGTIRDTRGELLPPNQVIYRDVLDGVRADLVYTYRKQGIEADVVLREVPPGPEEFGLIPETTRIEVVTEFFDPPEPVKSDRMLATLADPQLRDSVAEPDWVDEDLNFGPNRIVEGRAFAWSAREAAQARPEEFAPVGKRWLQADDGRTLLVESAEYVNLFDELLDLPGTAQRIEALRERSRSWAGRAASEVREDAFARYGARFDGPAGRWDGALGVERESALAFLTRPNSVASAIEGGIRIASTTSDTTAPGLVLDWNTLTAGATNFTFSSTNTYYVTGNCWFGGTTTFEGGTVIKFPVKNSTFTSVTVYGPVVCRTSAYRPAVFTAESDNTVGETIVAGVPNPATDFGSRQLRILNVGVPVVLEHLRIKHAYEGLYFQGTNPDNRVRHCQFVNCRFPVSNSANTPVRMHNVLIHGGKTSGTVFSGAFTPFTGEHLTIHDAPALLSGGSLSLTNSIVAAVTSVQAYSGAGNWQVSNPAGLFEAVGAGGFYLPAASALRNAGVAGIDARLQQDLWQMTSDAPLAIAVYSGIETNLAVRARRDTDAPDIGYHYPPLDYAVGGLSLVGASFRMSDGVALGTYGASGIALGAGAVFESVGSASKPNRVVHFAQVQEQTASAWANPAGDQGLLSLSGLGAGAVPEIRWVFTEASLPTGPANRRQWLRQATAGGFAMRTTHSQVRGLSLTITGNVPGISLSLTNTLLEDVDLGVSQSASGGFHPVSFRAFNNLFRGGSLALANTRVDSPWVIQDNLFDPLTMSASGLSGTLSHNGFRAGLPVFGANNRTGLVMDYAGGPLGRYAYPTSGGGTSLASLIDRGSRSPAAAGLVAMTVRSDGVPESGATVDPGFHYPAVLPASSGLIGHWRLDESGGTTAADDSPNGFDGTLVNGPLWMPAHLGNGLHFDGINDQVQIPDAPALRFTTPFTVAFWARKETENPDYTLYVGKGDSVNRNFAIWDIAGPSGRVMFQFRSAGGTYYSIGSTAELRINRWYHVACTWDGANGRIYIDGKLDRIGAMAGVPLTSADPVVFGYAGYHAPFAGFLDDVCILNRAVGDSEVPGLMNSGPSGGHAQGALGSWTFNQTAGSVANDGGSLALHGTLNYGPQWQAGQFSTGLRFNGRDDVVTVADASALRLTSGMTVAFWVNKASEPDDYVRIVGKGGGTARNYGVWDIGGPTRRVMFQFRVADGSYRTLSSVRDVNPGEWHHVAATWDGGTGRIYVDGTLDATGPMAGPPLTSTEPLTMGYAGYHTYFDGVLDEVLILDRAATSNEVASLVTQGVPVSGMSGTVAAWSLNQSSGGQATDGSGNGFHGVLNTGPQWTSGQVGNALRFDGISDVVTVADRPELRMTGPFSVAFWVRKDSENSDFVRYVGKGDPTARNFGLWDLAGDSGRAMLQFRTPGGAYQTVSSLSSVPVGVWSHLAGTWDGATGRIYVNGELDSSGPMAGPPATSSAPLTFGYAGYHGRLEGALDGIEIHDRALDPLEVAALLRVSPADGDADGLADASEDRDGDGLLDAGETSWVDADSDYDGRSDSEERGDGTDPANAKSVKPVRLGLWNFDTAADPWTGDNGSTPWELTGVDLVEITPYVFAPELDTPGAVLRYRDVEANGRANINVRNGTVRIQYFPYWASNSPDCAPGTSGLGPGSPIELVSVGEFSLGIDAQGTNLVFVSPAPGGGTITNLQAAFRVCDGDYLPEFPMDIQVSYATNASGIFLDGKLLARGSGIQAVPNAGSRNHGLFLGSSPDRTRQAQGLVDAVFTYNVPLDLCTNAASMSLVVTSSPPSVTLKWAAISNCTYRIDRRLVTSSTWQTIASVTPPSYTDVTILPGQAYEYRLQADVAVPQEFFKSTDPAPLTMTSGVRLPPAEAPGHVVLVTDRTLTNNATYASSVSNVIRDLSAEGWVVARFDGPRHDDVTWANNPARIAEVKNWIAAYRIANPDQTRAVLLFGHLPTPRSGLLSPDGHPFRPLPTDAYYADFDGVWTDALNVPAGPGIVGANLAGDGIFDQEFVPANPAGIAAVELAVGRVDFANMPTFASATPSRGEADLLEQYASKSRRYRRAEITLPERAVYGAYFSSNAMSEAQDYLGAHLTKLAQRLGTAVVGTNASGSVKADFFTAELPAVWGVTGGFAGGYSSIHSRGEVWPYHGITLHQTSDLLEDEAEPPIAFSIMHASWMAEWDAADHLGRALLSTRNYGYGWSYAGASQFEWQYPAMALGHTIGEAWRKTQNDAWMWPLVSAQYQSVHGVGVKTYLGVPSQGGYIYASLLGDPTLRQAPTAPAGTLVGQVAGPNQIDLTWGPSPAPGATYHVYRSGSGIGGAWTRLTETPTAATNFTDSASPPGAPAYMVRALVLRSVASGSITNLSAGSVWP